MQTIEIYTPNRDGNGEFLGLNHMVRDPDGLFLVLIQAPPAK